MIGKLTGLIDSSGDDWALIDVGGVGYVIFGSSRTLDRLGPQGTQVTVWVETHVREERGRACPRRAAPTRSSV